MPHLALKCLLVVLLGAVQINGALAQDDPFDSRALTHIDTLPPDSTHKQLPWEIEQFINEEIEFKVPVITCQQLWKMQQNGRQKLAILDARSQKEFDISHIKGAKRVGYDDFSPDRIWFVDQDITVVIYCRVGKQSEKIALELQEMGFTNILNLYGSIIEWVNQGLPIVDKNGKRTRRVYVFNKKERALLKKGEGVN